MKRLFFLSITVSLLAIFGLADTVEAANFACTGGDVACLIAAMNAANANGQANTISLAEGTYVLTTPDNNNTDGPNGLPSVTGSLIIAGAGDELTSIVQDGPQFFPPQFRLVHVAATGSLTIRGVSLHVAFTGGQFFDGYSLFNRGTVAMIDCTISNNNAHNGVPLVNAGTMSITDTVISNNSTTEGTTSGILNTGSLNVTNSIFSGNVASNGQGVIRNEGGTVTIDTTTFRNNSSPDANAGGIANLSGTVTITRSAVIGNHTSDSGGAVYNFGTVNIFNSTLAQNTAGGPGGAIYNAGGGVVTIASSTVSGNSSFCCANGRISSGGIVNGGGTVRLENSIVAQNSIAFSVGQNPTLSDCAGTITSLGNNLIGTLDSCTVALQNGDITGDPGLDTFTDNGTPGNGHFPLLLTSRAIDAGNDAACPPTDQLGQPRFGHCDIGAIEFQPLIVTIDIKPGGNPPSINPRSAGIITVAIVTTSAFNATTVDPSTVRFGKTGTEAAPVRSTLDVNGKGTLDLTLKFNTRDTGITCGDTSASLTGKTLSKFPIWGSDAIVTVGCH
jgi:hypothetical protein